VTAPDRRIIDTQIAAIGIGLLRRCFTLWHSDLRSSSASEAIREANENDFLHAEALAGLVASNPAYHCLRSNKLFCLNGLHYIGHPLSILGVLERSDRRNVEQASTYT